MDQIPDLKRELNNLLVKINSDYCDIKYSVYRTALKLCRLQEVLHLHDVNSASVCSSLKGHTTNDSHFITDEVMTFKELHAVVINILKLSGIQNFPETAKLSKYLTLLMFETFKNVKENNVSLISVALFFIVLCKDEIQPKYKQLFRLYAGPLGMLNRSRAGLLIAHLVRITDVVGESGSFGRIAPAVESCFEGVLGATVSLHHFLKWLLREPQPVVWLPTMHRLLLARTSLHDVECATCKVRPIVGLRFQCLKCLDYDSCQRCFLSQQPATRSHKPGHPRQEYCLPAGGREKVNAFARTIRNIVTKRYKRKDPSSSFLPIHDDNYSDASLDGIPQPPDTLNASADIGEVSHLAAEEKEQLEALVKKLKKENKKISGTVYLLESSRNARPEQDEDQSVLQDQLATVQLHNQHLQAELDNLKCVVFADNFMDSLHAKQDGSEEEESDSPHLEETLPTAKPRKKQKRKTRSDDFQSSGEREPPEGNHEQSSSTKFEAENSNESISPEDQLREIVSKLAASLDENLNHLPLRNNRICLAADKVQEDLNNLLDQAILMQN